MLEQAGATTDGVEPVDLALGAARQVAQDAWREWMGRETEGLEVRCGRWLRGLWLWAKDWFSALGRRAAEFRARKSAQGTATMGWFTGGTSWEQRLWDMIRGQPNWRYAGQPANGEEEQQLKKRGKRGGREEKEGGRVCSEHFFFWPLAAYLSLPGHWIYSNSIFLNPANTQSCRGAGAPPNRGRSNGPIITLHPYSDTPRDLRLKAYHPENCSSKCALMISYCKEKIVDPKAYQKE